MDIIINSEECRNIIGFEKYHISESGRIYRTDNGRKRSKRTMDKLYLGENKVHFKLIKGKLKLGNVYLTDKKGKLHNLAISILIARAFGILLKKKLSTREEIGYKDSNEQNLHYTNLFLKKRIYAKTTCKLSQEDVNQIKKHIKKGIALRRIGLLFCVSEMQINRIKTGENWGNGKRKIKAPKAPFDIKEMKIKKYIATFDREETVSGIKKRFKIKRNPESPTDNVIIGIVNGYKLSLKHTNITRAKENVQKLNDYFF
mgnify:CR=1 FL=1|tara:strand:- start:370 stop:1143 length:774 start_codon:yes stop_codon:yes gene_type:complete